MDRDETSLGVVADIVNYPNVVVKNIAFSSGVLGLDSQLVHITHSVDNSSPPL